ncbi:MAG TPA: glycoside hydrolase family 125 protein [Bacillota bacterium]|nr:glycoside hydrolase family 125 protein [Clostridiales bacterium]HPT85129.1 glycoside hydrolase family 125 protein [Bacillota bacterium]
MLTPSLKQVLADAEIKLSGKPKLLENFKNCFVSTIETTVKRLPDGDTFVITGDIPAMWLRDSSAQVKHYLPFTKDDPELQAIIEGLIARQAKCILIDPYANAFNESPNNNRVHYDRTILNAMIWERKYEVDSLCYPVWLAYLYYKASGSKRIFTDTFKAALHTILDTFITEQRHFEKSPYTFIREERYTGGRDTETLQNEGRGLPVNYTGMTWSGFRPSDDACTFGYLIPSNMFAVVILGYIMEFAEQIYGDEYMYEKARKLRHEINYGIKAYAIYRHPTFGSMYAYETDGFGNYTLMDDANVPSLLSIPYLGYTTADDKLYKNTRAFVLSKENPYFYEGTAAKGIGSPHTPEGYIWHIALSMQGLTATDKAESREMIDLILATDAGKGVCHEGFDANDPARFTREWFAWANSLFAELVYETCLK